MLPATINPSSLQNELYNQMQPAVFAPADVLQLIFSNLPISICPAVALTCRKWEKLISDNNGLLERISKPLVVSLHAMLRCLEIHVYPNQHNRLRELIVKVKERSLSDLSDPSSQKEIEKQTIELLSEVDPKNLDPLTENPDRFPWLFATAEISKRTFKGALNLMQAGLKFTGAVNEGRIFNISPAGRSFIFIEVHSLKDSAKSILTDEWQLFISGNGYSETTLIHFPRCIDIQMLASKQFGDTINFTLEDPMEAVLIKPTGIKGPLYFKLRLVKTEENESHSLEEVVQNILQNDAMMDEMEPEWTFMMPEGQGYDKKIDFS